MQIYAQEPVQVLQSKRPFTLTDEGLTLETSPLKLLAV